jgi:hypothetical protein
MVRRFLDEVAAGLGYDGHGSLAQKIEWLHDSGLIDDRLHEWTDALRLAGNRAAHDVSESVTREDAGDILALAEAIADHLFVIKARFEAFQGRHSGS